MNINRNNYEKYFIDYLEGNLSQEAIHDLRVFLLLNEDLSELLEGIEEAKLTPPVLSYDRKESLKKDSLHACADYYAIALAEHALSPQDIQMIDHISRKQEIEEQAKIYRKLKLKPDQQISYTHKSKLYHSSYRQLIYRYSSIAAAIFLMITASLAIFNIQRQPQAIKIAMILPPIPEIPLVELPLFLQKQPIIAFQPHQSEPVLVVPQSPIKIPVATIRELPLSGIAQNSVYHSNEIRLIPSDFSSPELILSEDALEWKPSESKFFSNNLFSSMITTGKMIAEKFKTIQTNSNK